MLRLKSFLGGNAYVSGSGGVQSSSFTRNGGDPFTGDNAYKTNGAAASHDFFPQIEFLKFSNMPKMEGLKNKLLEFNSQVPESLRLQEDQFDSILSLGKSFRIYLTSSSTISTKVPSLTVFAIGFSTY